MESGNSVTTIAMVKSAHQRRGIGHWGRSIYTVSNCIIQVSIQKIPYNLVRESTYRVEVGCR